MSMINKVILIGNLGADPELRYTQGGSQVASFNVATTERWKGQDGASCALSRTCRWTSGRCRMRMGRVG